jgi:uncharacterized membrane protein SirB2
MDTMLMLQGLAIVGIFAIPYAAYRGWKTDDLIEYIAMIVLVSLTSILVFSVTVEHLLS